MTKEDWLATILTQYPGANEEVLNFISDVIFRYEYDKMNAVLHDFFSNGYCYHFAVMLNNMFPKGKIMWLFKRGHIVWYDAISRACYDITDVYIDYTEGELMDLDCLASYELAGFTKNNTVLQQLGVFLCDFDMTPTVTGNLYSNGIVTLSGQGTVYKSEIPYQEDYYYYDVAKAINLI